MENKYIRNYILLLIVHIIIFKILSKYNLNALIYLWGGCFVLLYQKYVLDVKKINK